MDVMKNGFFFVVICLVAGLLACSTDDGDGSPDAASAADVAGAVEVVADTSPGDLPAPECPGLPDMTGKVFRITSLVAKDPTDKINEVWAADIGDYELVILFHVVEHDMAAGTAKLRVTSATAEKETAEDGTITPLKYNYMLDPAVFNAYFEGCRIRWDEPIELDIVTSTISKPFHVFGITGFCDISEDGTEILHSWLSGAILESEAQDLCMTIPGMGVANFHWFMNLAHICPVFDSDKDGNLDSYKFTGTLAGVEETELFDDAIIPFTTDIECDPHLDQCQP
jgi:hypothetical protein